jgi:hypothetical protein
MGESCRSPTLEIRRAYHIPNIARLAKNSSVEYSNIATTPKPVGPYRMQSAIAEPSMPHITMTNSSIIRM